MKEHWPGWTTEELIEQLVFDLKTYGALLAWHKNKKGLDREIAQLVRELKKRSLF